MTYKQKKINSTPLAKRILSILLIIFLFTGMLPTNNLIITKVAKAADNGLEDPLKDYVFDESNVVTLDLFDGNYIYIYDDGYVQGSVADTTKNNLIAHTGNYIIKGTSGSDCYVTKISGDSDIKFKKISCRQFELSIQSDTSIVIDESLRIQRQFIITAKNTPNLNLIGVNGGNVTYDTQFSITGLGDLNISSLTLNYLTKDIPTDLSVVNFTIKGVNVTLFDLIVDSSQTRHYIDATNNLTIYNSDFKFTNTRAKSQAGSSSAMIIGTYNQTANINIESCKFISETNVAGYSSYTINVGSKNTVINNCDARNLLIKPDYSSLKVLMSNTSMTEIINPWANLSANYSYERDRFGDICGANSRKYVNVTVNTNSHNTADSFYRTSNKTTYNYNMFIATSASVDRFFWGGSKLDGTLMPIFRVGNVNFMNLDGDYLYPSVISVNGLPDTKVFVQVDDWEEEATTYTDENGYIYPWLTSGEHDITITLEDGSTSTIKSTPSTDFTPNIDITIPVLTNKQNINVGLPSTEVKYSYDNANWITSTTDNAGILTLDVESGHTNFYVKTTQIPTLAFHAPITDDVIGAITKLQPTILSQTNTIKVKRTDTATIHVIAAPSSEENGLVYEWYRGSQKLSSNTNICEVVATGDEDFNTYYCKVTESNGLTVTSAPIIITEDTSLSGLESEIDELKKKQQELQDELDVTKEREEQLEKDLTDSNTENATLKSEIESLKQEIERLQELVNSYLERISDLEDEVSRLEQELANKETTLEEKEDEINGYKDTIKNLTEQINNALNENTSMRQLIDAIKNELGVTEDTDIIIAIRDLKNRVAALESDKSILQSTLDDANDRITELETIISNLTGENSALKEQLEILKAEKQTLEEQITTITDKNNELLDKVAELEESNRNASTTITELREQISDLEIRISEQETIISNLTSTVQSYENLLEQIRNALGITTNEEILPAIEALKQKIASLEADKSRLQTDLDDANTRITILEELVNSGSGENTELLEQIEKLQKEKEELTTQIIIITQTNEDLANRITELENSLNDANITISELRQTIIDLNIQISEQNTTITNLNIKITTMESLIELIKKALGVNTTEEILPAIEQLKQSVAELAESVRGLEVEKEHLTDQLNKEIAAKDTLSEFIEQIRNLVGADNNDEIADKILEYQKQIADKDLIIKDLIASNAEKDITIAELNQKIEELNKRIEELLNTINADKSELLEEIERLNQEVIELKKTITNLENELIQYKQKVAELTSDVINLKEEIVKLKYELELATKTIEELRKECVDAKTQNTLLQDELAKAKEQISTLEQENLELKAKLERISTLEEENRKLKEEIANLKAQLEANSGTPNTPIVDTPSIELPKDSVIVTPVEDSSTMITDNSSSITATKGWEVSTGLNDKWSDELDKAELLETNALFTFFTGEDTASALSMKTEKRVIYTRKKSVPNNVYICSVGIRSDEINNYQTPDISISSNIKELKLAEDESNTTRVSVQKTAKIDVKADCGSVGLKSLYYMVVALDNDFDPDGAWKAVKSNSISYKVTEPVRIYIKAVDNEGNYTVSKTVVLQPYQEAPVFNMNKLLYVNSSYILKLDLDEDSTATYKSSDKNIATVTSKGKITGAKVGKTTITVTVKDNNTNEILSVYKINITVKEGNDSFFNYSLKDNTIASSTIGDNIMQQYKHLEVGSSSRVKITNAKDANVVYITTDKNVATVSKDGIIKAKKKGSTNILVTVTQNNKSYVYAIKVRVSNGTKDDSVGSYLE